MVVGDTNLRIRILKKKAEEGSRRPRTPAGLGLVRGAEGAAGWHCLPHILHSAEGAGPCHHKPPPVLSQRLTFGNSASGEASLIFVDFLLPDTCLSGSWFAHPAMEIG